MACGLAMFVKSPLAALIFPVFSFGPLNSFTFHSSEVANGKELHLDLRHEKHSNLPLGEILEETELS